MFLSLDSLEEDILEKSSTAKFQEMMESLKRSLRGEGIGDNRNINFYDSKMMIEDCSVMDSLEFLKMKSLEFKKRLLEEEKSSSDKNFSMHHKLTLKGPKSDFHLRSVCILN